MEPGMIKSGNSSPDARPAGNPILLAEKNGIGMILHYESNDVYELRLNMADYKESHFMTGDEWEEFTDFSGQDERTEFFILLKEKYPKLSDILEDDKMRMDFLTFIESSYDGTQTPREVEQI